MTSDRSTQEILKQHILQMLARVDRVRFVSAWPATSRTATRVLAAMKVEGLIKEHGESDGAFSITDAGRAALEAR